MIIHRLQDDLTRYLEQAKLKGFVYNKKKAGLAVTVYPAFS
jgi:hypothetical protein